MNNAIYNSHNFDKNIQLKTKNKSKSKFKYAIQSSQNQSHYEINLKPYYNHKYNIQPEYQPILKNSHTQTPPITKYNSKSQSDTKKRKQITLFILNCLCTLNVAYQNILFFFTNQSDTKDYYLAPSIMFMILFFLFNAIYCSKSIKQFFFISFLIDNILLTQIVASIGFVGLNKVYMTGLWHEYFSIINVPILHFLLSANFRLLMLNVKWNRSKTIIYKLVLLGGAIVFFSIGTYIMFIDYKLSQGLSPSIDSTFKDFTLLYTFGNFSFFSELYAKVCDFDKTNDLSLSYKIQIPQQEQDSQQNQGLKQSKKDNIISDNNFIIQSPQRFDFKKDLGKQIKQGSIYF